MKKAIWVVGMVLLGVGAAWGGVISEDPGELTASGLYWIPGSGDFDPGNAVGRGQRGCKALGQFARRAAGDFGQSKGEGAGEIAVRPVAGALQRDVGRRVGGQQPVLA